MYWRHTMKAYQQHVGSQNHVVIIQGVSIQELQGHNKWYLQKLLESKFCKIQFHRNDFTWLLIILIGRVRLIGGRAFHNQGKWLKWKCLDVLLGDLVWTSLIFEKQVPQVANFIYDQVTWYVKTVIWWFERLKDNIQ